MIKKDAVLPIYNGNPKKSPISAQDKLRMKHQQGIMQSNAKKYSKSQASQPNQRDLRMRYRRKRKRRTARRRIGAHELSHDHSEKSRKTNTRINKTQRELRDAGFLRTKQNTTPDILSG